MKIFCNLQKLSHVCAQSWNSEDVEVDNTIYTHVVYVANVYLFVNYT